MPMQELYFFAIRVSSKHIESGGEFKKWKFPGLRPQPALKVVYGARKEDLFIAQRKTMRELVLRRSSSSWMFSLPSLGKRSS